jgi:hypothetical protein
MAGKSKRELLAALRASFLRSNKSEMGIAVGKQVDKN